MSLVVVGQPLQGVQRGEADRGLVGAELLGGGVVQLGDPPLGRVQLPQRGRQLGVPLPPERQHQPDHRARTAASGQAGAHSIHPDLRPIGTGRGVIGDVQQPGGGQPDCQRSCPCGRQHPEPRR